MTVAVGCQLFFLLKKVLYQVTMKNCSSFKIFYMQEMTAMHITSNDKEIT